jgi:hypothetical protein
MERETVGIADRDKTVRRIGIILCTLRIDTQMTRLVVSSSSCGVWMTDGWLSFFGSWWLETFKNKEGEGHSRETLYLFHLRVSTLPI